MQSHARQFAFGSVTSISTNIHFKFTRIITKIKSAAKSLFFNRFYEVTSCSGVKMGQGFLKILCSGTLEKFIGLIK